MNSVPRDHGEGATQTREFTAAALRSAAGAGDCAAVVRHAVDVIEREFATLERDGASVACVAGCDFCCHQRVGLLPHEAIALLHELRTVVTPAIAERIEQRVRANAARIAGLSAREHLALRMPCAFLVDGRCAVYSARPANCSAYHSLSRARCEYAFANPQDAGTPRNSRPALLELTQFCDEQIAATRAGVVAAGLDATKGELNAYLLRLLDDAGAVERWLRGDALDAA
jgi:hypothetical protein